MTRTLAYFIVNGYMMSDQKAKEEVLARTAGLSIDEIEQAQLYVLTGQAAKDEWVPGMPAPLTDSDYANFDKVMQVFGGDGKGHAGVK